MENKKVFIKKIAPSFAGSFFDIFLQEEDGDRVLSISIGEYEAQRLAMEMDGIKSSRPLTYDLLTHILKGYEITIEEVVISKFLEGTYHADIVCYDGNERKIFDARVSDALNMALKYKSPIFASENVLNNVGFSIKDLDENTIEIREITVVIDAPKYEEIEDLEILLQEAIDKEDYDAAAKIRDKIAAIKENKK